MVTFAKNATASNYDNDTSYVRENAGGVIGESRILSMETTQAQEKKIRDAVRDQCRIKLTSNLSEERAYSEKDIRSYVADCLADTALEQVGKMTHEQKLDAIRQNLHEFIPQTIAKVKALTPDFVTKIDKVAGKGISTGSAARWKERLFDPQEPWWKKEAFLTKKFPEYYKNWVKLGESLDTLKKLQEEQKVGKDDLPELAVVHASGFIDLHYSVRAGAVDKAIARLKAHEKGQVELYKEAESMLQDAVSKGALSEDKVGTWLRRIFQTKAKQELIVQFLRGSGSTTLRGLIRTWQEAARQFDLIEDKRVKAKPQPRYTFISKAAFLDMHYKARLAYIQETNFRFANINKENPLLLDIRRDIDMKDWDSAEALILVAKRTDLSPKDTVKLGSMENLLAYQRQKEEEAGPKPEEKTMLYESCEDELTHILSQVEHPDVRKLIKDAALRGPGVLRCLAALLYNRKWTHEHGYLDGSKEVELREKTTDETRDVLRKGHGKKFENNNGNMGGAAIRNYNEGEWSAQILHAGVGAHGSLLARMDRQQDNYAFKYWTTLIPDGLDYDAHLHIVDSVMPQVRSCMRKWEGKKPMAAPASPAPKAKRPTPRAAPTVTASTSA